MTPFGRCFTTESPGGPKVTAYRYWSAGSPTSIVVRRASHQTWHAWVSGTDRFARHGSGSTRTGAVEDLVSGMTGDERAAAYADPFGPDTLIVRSAVRDDA